MDRQPDDTPGPDRPDGNDSSRGSTNGRGPDDADAETHADGWDDPTTDRDGADDRSEDMTDGWNDSNANYHPDDRARASDDQYCSSCGERIKREAEICPHCGVRVAGTSSTDEKDPGIAAVISLIVPGGGQVYNEQIVRGAAFFGVYAVFWMFVFVTMFILIGFLFMFLAPVFHLVAAWDAYTQATKINSGEVVV